jgi:hypothetical protein
MYRMNGLYLMSIPDTHAPGREYRRGLKIMWRQHSLALVSQARPNPFLIVGGGEGSGCILDVSLSLAHEFVSPNQIADRHMTFTLSRDYCYNNGGVIRC